MKNLDERVQNAIKTNPEIISSWENLDSATGHTTAEMEALGLGKQDLKWLERKGLAVRAYTANGYMHYFEDESGAKMQQRRFQGGSRVKWILLAPKSEVASG